MYIAVVGNNGNVALVVCVCILSRSVCVVLCVSVCVSLDTKSDLYTTHTHTVLGDLVVVCTYIHTCTYVCCIWSEPYTGFSVMSWVVVITTPA